MYPEIDYATVINSFVSTEGGGGFMTNYIYYSVLVVYKNGTRKIVEDRLTNILSLLPYIRTPLDEIRKLRDDMEYTLKTLQANVSSLQQNQEENFNYVLNTLYPVPDLTGTDETTATEQLHALGYIPVLLNDYPPSTPKNGIVRNYVRSKTNFKAVVLDIVHPIPEITGMTFENATCVLTDAGFNYDSENRFDNFTPDGTILTYTRRDDLSMDVHLVVSRKLPDFRHTDYRLAVEEVRKLGYSTHANYAYSETYEKDTVINASLGNGREITFTISNGPEPKPEPVVVPPAENPERYVCSVCQMEYDDYYSTCPLCLTQNSLVKLEN